MRAPPFIRSVLAVLATASLAGLAACTDSTSSGLDGTIGKGTSGGDATVPGTPADYTAFLGNYTGQVVILRSATLLPLKGFPAPRLVHLAVEPGREFAAADIGWPPSQPKLALAPFAGYHVWRGRRVRILYSVAASNPGEYADLGIRVTVLAGGNAVTVDVIGAAATCVKWVLKTDCPNSFYNRFFKIADSDP